MATITNGRRWAVAAAPALVALVLVACGDDDGVDTGGDALSSEAYAEAGQELCATADAGVTEAFPDFEGEPTIEQVMQLGTDLEPVLQRFRDGVAELEPPTDAAARQADLVAALDDAIATTHSMGTTTEGAEAALDAGGPPLDEFSAIANELFPGCTGGEDG